jgi:hypothetical protein
MSPRIFVLFFAVCAMGILVMTGCASEPYSVLGQENESEEFEFMFLYNTEEAPVSAPDLLQRLVYAYGELYWVWVTSDENQEVITWLHNSPFDCPPSFLYREGYDIWDWGFVWETPYANAVYAHHLAYHEPSGRWRDAGVPFYPPPPQDERWGHDLAQWSYTCENGWVHTSIPEATAWSKLNYAMVFHGRLPVLSVEGISGWACSHILNNGCIDGCDRNHFDDLILVDGRTFINVYANYDSSAIVCLFELQHGQIITVPAN